MIEKKGFIKDLRQGEKVEDVFLLVRAKQWVSKNGDPYWDLELQDRTGRIPGKIWYPASVRYPSIEEESFFYIKGYVDSFRDNLQVVINELLAVEEGEVSWEDFLPCVKTSPEELMEELEGLCKRELRYKPWRRLCGLILTDDYIREKFLICPAAKSIHHAYRGGLLEHTLSVCKICLKICDLFEDLDREILLVAATLHDLGKIEEFMGKVSIDYSDKGQLLGHIILGLEMLSPFLKKVGDIEEGLILHLKHLILSHHGEYEFGSPRIPLTREAFVLHLADNLDAKLNTISSLLQSLEGEEENWSRYQRSLERRIFRPLNTLDLLEDRKREGRRLVTQCLLPLKE